MERRHPDGRAKKGREDAELELGVPKRYRERNWSYQQRDIMEINKKIKFIFSKIQSLRFLPALPAVLTLFASIAIADSPPSDVFDTQKEDTLKYLEETYDSMPSERWSNKSKAEYKKLLFDELRRSFKEDKGWTEKKLELLKRLLPNDMKSALDSNLMPNCFNFLQLRRGLEFLVRYSDKELDEYTQTVRDQAAEATLYAATLIKDRPDKDELLSIMNGIRNVNFINYQVKRVSSFKLLQRLDKNEMEALKIDIKERIEKAIEDENNRKQKVQDSKKAIKFKGENPFNCLLLQSMSNALSMKSKTFPSRIPAQEWVDCDKDFEKRFNQWKQSEKRERLKDAQKSIMSENNSTGTPTKTDYEVSNKDFIKICKDGSPEEIIKALSMVTKINFKDETGATPLCYLAESNEDIDAIAILLEAGAKVNDRDKNGETPLFYALSSNGNAEVISALIKAGANVNETNNNGITPLMSDIEMTEKPEIMFDLLLKAGADINARDNDGMTPLMWQARTGDVELVRALIKAGAKVNDRDKKGMTALMWASRCSKAESLKILIGADSIIDSRDNEGMTALMHAVSSSSKNSIDTVEQLINAGAKIDDCDNLGRTTLMHAASGANIEMIKFLLNAGQKIDTKDKNGMTVLMHLAQNMSPSCEKAMEELINAGAKVNDADNDGKTALMHVAMARSDRKTDLIKLLLEKGADAKIKSKEGLTAYDYASKNKYFRDKKTLELLK